MANLVEAVQDVVGKMRTLQTPEGVVEYVNATYPYLPSIQILAGVTFCLVQQYLEQERRLQRLEEKVQKLDSEVRPLLYSSRS